MPEFAHTELRTPPGFHRTGFDLQIQLIQCRSKFIPYLHRVTHRAGDVQQRFSRWKFHITRHGCNRGILLFLYYSLQRTFCGLTTIIDPTFHMHLSAGNVRIHLQIFDGKGIFSRKRYFTDNTVPHDLCFIRIGMRLIIDRNIMLFPVIDTDCQLMFPRCQVFRQIKNMRTDQALTTT